MVEADLTRGDIPSRRVPLLRALEGSRVVAMSRRLGRPPDEYSLKDNLLESEVFGLGSGSFLVETEGGVTIMFGADESQISVTLRLERGQVDGHIAPNVPISPTRHPIEATDPRFVDPAIAALVGRRIERVLVLRRDPVAANHVWLPREAGVVLRFEGGTDLIPAEDLHNGVDDFGVLLRHQIIPSAVPALRSFTPDEAPLIQPDIPSHRELLLRALEGARIVSMRRHLDKYTRWEARGRESEGFSQGPGILVFDTDRGMTIGWNITHRGQSVTLWLERASLDGTVRTGYIYDEQWMRPLDANACVDVAPSVKDLLGLRIVSVRVLERGSDEVGVVLRFEGAEELLLVRGIHNNSEDDFGVIRRDQLPPAIPGLRERIVFDTEPAPPAGNPPAGNPPVEIHARSVAEERLYLDLHPCACGQGGISGLRHELRFRGPERLSRFVGHCARCGRERDITFVLPEDDPPNGAFGGPEPSTLLDAGEFLAESDACAKQIPADPTSLTPEELGMAERTLERAVLTLDEVLKLIPGGADAVPEPALRSAAARLIVSREPGRFQRRRLEARRDAFRDLLARYRAHAGRPRNGA